MLTGDENIVDIDFEVVWNISDPAAFLSISPTHARRSAQLRNPPCAR